MGEPMKKTSCQIASWGMGAGGGFVAFIMLLFLGNWGFLQAVFGAGVIFFLVGAFLAFVMCRPLPQLGEVQAGMDELAHPVMPSPRSEPAAAPSGQAAVTAAPAAVVPAAEAEPVASPEAIEPEPAPKAEPMADAAVGTKPVTLSVARGGQPDDLKQIKGVGPKMEAMLHGMGFYHFDQVAAWSAAELAWVDENLTGFKGRASRDNWVAQAKVLAGGA